MPTPSKERQETSANSSLLTNDIIKYVKGELNMPDTPAPSKKRKVKDTAGKKSKKKKNEANHSNGNTSTASGGGGGGVTKKHFDLKIQVAGRKSLDTLTSKKQQKKRNKNGKLNESSQPGSTPQKSPEGVAQLSPIVEKDSGISSHNAEPPKKKGKKKKRKNVSLVEVKPEQASFYKPASPIKASGEENAGRKMFAWLLEGHDVDRFFMEVWEKKHLLLKRKNRAFYSHLISMKMIDQMLRQNSVEFTKNIDVTSYKDGARETHNPEGRAHAPVVWDFYSDGCSIRLLNPQTFLPECYRLNATLQEFFSCMVGANAYLTPPDSQGFAPHYDDIEAFVLQVEGRKRWRLYSPRLPNEFLARESSPNFTQEEIGEPILDTVLEPGDLLYFPRGFIHQANTVKGQHSLHVTLSVYQKHSWGDLVAEMVSAAVKSAFTNEIGFRLGLPLTIHHHLGLIHADSKSPEREQMIEFSQMLLGLLLKYVDVDNAMDAVCRRFQHDALPPFLAERERRQTAPGQPIEVNAAGEVVNALELEPTSRVRLVKKDILRLVAEGEGVMRIYYHADNSKEYHEYEPTYMEIEEEDSPAVQTLVQHYPNYIAVNELDVEEERRLIVAQFLFDRGLLMVE